MTDQELLQELADRLHKKEVALKEIDQTIEELNLAHKRLNEIDQLKSRFLSIVQNEFRNPLGTIIGMIHLLAQKSLKENLGLEEIAATILRESYYLTMQVDNILEAAQLEAGADIFDCQVVNLASVIEETVDINSHELRRQEMQLQVDIDEESMILADEEKMQVVINNLVNNAIKFNQPGGRIEIVSWREDAEVVVSVKDQGEGISPEEERVIFERFRQVDMSPCRKFQGSGLGLSVAQPLVDMMGGKLWLESKVGQGTTFYVSMPFAGEGTSEETDGLLFDTENDGDFTAF